MLLGRETILRNGEPVGYLTSGGYGYTIGKNIGYGYVRNADGVSDDFLPPATTSWWWRWSRSRRASTCSRSTIRPARA